MRERAQQAVEGEGVESLQHSVDNASQPEQSYSMNQLSVLYDWTSRTVQLASQAVQVVLSSLGHLAVDYVEPPMDVSTQREHGSR